VKKLFALKCTCGQYPIATASSYDKRQDDAPHHAITAIRCCEFCRDRQLDDQRVDLFDCQHLCAIAAGGSNHLLSATENSFVPEIEATEPGLAPERPGAGPIDIPRVDRLAELPSTLAGVAQRPIQRIVASIPWVCEKEITTN
jgi:hypothetical protein